MCALVAAIILACAALPAIAGEADVVAANAMRAADGTWTFTVTIRSHDKGINYYCDRFEVISPAGGVLGVRELDHPHVNEQPFTRELAGVKVPPGIGHGVLIRAHHNVAGYTGSTVKIRLRN